jgi:polyisoprenoid-binding protein YceI
MIDKDHSFANWSIRHVFARVSGAFYDVSGRIVLDPEDLKATHVDATIKVLSFSTGHRERDAHVLTSEFLDVLKYGEIHFVGTGVEVKGKDEGVLEGQLTLHGVTRTVRFPFKLLGSGPDPWGGYRGGFEAKTQLKRSDYGINWGLDTSGGGPLGDDVEITLLIEGVKLGPDGTPLKAK